MSGSITAARGRATRAKIAVAGARERLVQIQAYSIDMISYYLSMGFSKEHANLNYQDCLEGAQAALAVALQEESVADESLELIESDSDDFVKAR